MGFEYDREWRVGQIREKATGSVPKLSRNTVENNEDVSG